MTFEHRFENRRADEHRGIGDGAVKAQNGCAFVTGKGGELSHKKVETQVVRGTPHRAYSQERWPRNRADRQHDIGRDQRGKDDWRGFGRAMTVDQAIQRSHNPKADPISQGRKARG